MLIKPGYYQTDVAAQSGSPQALPAMTWDNSNKAANVTLSSGNLRVDASSTNNNTQTHGLHSNARTSGKYYYEIFPELSWSVDSAGFGCAMTSASLSTYVGNPNSAGYYSRLGGVAVNGSSAGTIQTNSTYSVFIGIAIDLDNKRIWFRTQSNTNWNNNASYDPVTNTGGIDISSLTGSIVPAITVGQNTYAFTANFGSTAYNMAAPSGFGNW